MPAVIVLAFLAGGLIGWVVAVRVRRDAGVGGSTPRLDAVSADGFDDDVVDGRVERDDVGSVLRSAVNELDLGVVVCDPHGRIIYRNRSASAMHGTHVGLIVEEHVEKVLRSASQGTPINDLVELHGPPRMALQLSSETMPDGMAVATIDDVTDRLRVEAMRTDFVANISHELKTPVGAIAVLADALEGETDPTIVERVTDRIGAEAHRAVRAIDDLLELSRIESGPHEPDVVDLTDVVNAAVSRGRVVDPAKNITVTAFESGSVILVRADRRQLESALGNLVENAVKYSDHGGTVQIRTRVDERSVEIMVADQGHGIPAGDLDRIFERFYRVDRARSRNTGGTGLGLSIVRHVASNHGGDVLVSSREGEGSTFVLRLPASSIVVDDPSAASTEATRTNEVSQ